MFLRRLKNWTSQFIYSLQKKQTRDLIGLDIGTDFLRALKINSTTTPFKVENLSIIAIPPGAIINSEIKDYTAIETVLKKMLAQLNTTTHAVAIAIPRSIAIIKNINIDSRLKTDEIESRAWIEANQHFPDLIGNIYLDFMASGPLPGNPAKQELTLVACRKDQINSYLHLLQKAGLNTKIVDVNCYALARALPLTINQATPLETVALLNLNINLSSLMIIHNNKLIHAHDQSYDGQRLLSQTQKYRLKKLIDEHENHQLLDDIEYNAALKEHLLSHLRHIFNFFYTSHPGFTIQKIILSGDCAVIPDLFLFIQREINIETTLANPFAHMTLADNINADEIKKHAPTLMLCCGLALSKTA
ncbi:MAG: hypothetical protein A3E83_00380 [Gammaproteobacteria bacterium RIFCSPHIGHO2_12_FULL_41_20]|nr:MAG: hypothetical protein A3E83_00380 [Gammaproteobacteria bacterium RIFCSPHIGHO2_12_FULL_41_20]